MRLAASVAALAGSAIAAASEAAAACWRLEDGRIVETASASTPPTAGAVAARCPTPSLVRPSVKTFDRRPDSRECVEYARSRVPSLPGGLWTIGDKRAIINSAAASVGSVAVVDVPGGRYREAGHVAVVDAVTANSITISETNFGGRHFQRRTATAASLRDAETALRIVGYFHP